MSGTRRSCRICGRAPEERHYGSLTRPGLASCGSKNDCHATEAELRSDGHWWARLGMPVSSSNDRLDWVLIDWVPIDENPIVKGPDGKPRLSSKCAQASLTSVTGLQHSNRQPDSFATLTQREIQILTLLSQGRSYALIAAELGVTYKSVVNTSHQLRLKIGGPKFTGTDTESDRHLTRTGLI